MVNTSKLPPFVEMLDCAIHSGKGAKVSRQKIYSYMRDNYSLSTDTPAFKARFKKAVDKRLDEGLVAQDKSSFIFTPKGQKFFEDTYESSEEEEEDETPTKKGKSKKVEESTKPAKGRK
ncbi:hypothetical protein JCM10450v2_008033 [Rhodotorula kratochvilovae]